MEKALTASHRLRLGIRTVTANALRSGSDFGGAAGVIAKPFTRAVLAHGLSYLEECVRRPPPVSVLPSGMRMAPRFLPS